MKKVAIITFHRAMNCGAMLQAFALQNILSRKYDSYILDYRCKEIEYVYGYRKSIKKRVKMLAKLALRTQSTIQEIKRSRSFKKFAKEYLRVSECYTDRTVNRANKLFDAFIAGSDQIWNPKWSNKDWNYYLTFADPNKKYSYSASFGGASISQDNKDEIKNNLLSFRSILVREHSAVDIIQNLGIAINNISVTCDPVFLISKKEWIEKFQLCEKKDGYILLYFATTQTNSVEVVKRIVKRTGKKVIYFNSFDVKSIDASFENLIVAGPVEFVSLIMNADLVITTSFHAMAFSLIFNTPFLYELNTNKENNNSRLENLASIFSVEHREITSCDRVDYKDIDWNRVNFTLEKYKEDSMVTLFQSLETID
ncbi:polysaccharide pyruvyl transferase family protein [Anaerostipes faecalis]|uniref:polysaccharide pyruvyl transferase family protein n=1 Tax=Anaerostipes faecalis TaxID=2738446 RepID=UPI003F0578FB